MALNKLQKWIGTQAMTAFFDQLNDNVDATNAAIDLLEYPKSGSNTNGNWIQYADGTMECYLVKAVENFTLSFSYGAGDLGFNYYDWTYPKPFMSVPHVAVGRAQISTGAQWGSTRQNTAAKAQAVVWGGVGNTGTLNITLHATGRWK